ncbi:MAG: leucine-rich repeat protein [Clostridia bacterium]|nr:leucine-rich repeat protein [Clostridia bacterium]
MKKILSVILIMTIVFATVSQELIAVAEDFKDSTAIYSFADDLSRIIRENDVDASFSSDDISFDDILFRLDYFFNQTQSSSSIYDNLYGDSFETKRLIVKAKSLHDYRGAIDCVSGYNDLYILQYESRLSAKKAYEYYLNSSSAEYVEPDTIYSSQEDEPSVIIPDKEGNEYNDVTAAAIQWLSDKIGFNEIKERLAERIEDDYILVAVLDSGVDTDHELLKDRLVECNVNMSGSGNLNTAEDDYGHGTHVAGIIVNNTLSNVKIKPYKVLNSEGKGSLSTIALALDMAVLDGADIVNISISGRSVSPTMTNSVNNAVENDVNVVVAAGNSKLDLNKNYVSPACIESAITVSATDRNDNLASFSNYNGTIDIAAPGVDIESSYLNNTYTSLNGTSMAAPQVAAGLAILKSILLDISASKCEELIKDFAIDIRENVGENHFGSGVLYLKYILDGKPTTADPVFSVPSGTFDRTFTVEITCPDEDAEIYYYVSDNDFSTFVFENGIVYQNPITVSIDAKIYAVALKKGCKLSSIVTVEYDRVGNAEEDYYDINILGFITNYYGSDADLVVPDVIKGKVVNGIAIGAFQENRKTQNIVLPDTCKTINPAAFKDCVSLKSVSGAGVEDISINAFENSPVEIIDFPNLESIGSYAFAGCSELKSITLSNVESINSYAFSGTTSLGPVICDNLTEIGTEAFAQSGISLFSAPKLTSMENNVFVDCHNLISASMPALTVLSLGTFKNCISLSRVELDSVTDIKANALRNTAIDTFVGLNVESVGNYAFADNPHLVACALMKVPSTGAYLFHNCTALKIAYLPALEEVNSNTFANCQLLTNLYLPNVKTVLKDAFKNSYVENIMFEKVQTVRSLPNTLKGIMLSGTTTSITSVPAGDFVVYGFEDTYAEKYADNNGKAFKKVPVFHESSSTQVTVGDKYIVVYAFGFNCEYQWYKNDILSNVGGTPIEGATSFYYMPSPDDDSAAYYCVVTSRNGEHVSSNTTLPIVNAPDYRKADYSQYNNLKQEIYSLNRNLYDEELLNQLDELSNVDMSDLKLSQQDILDTYVQQLQEMLTLVKNSFVLGDLNFDGRVSAIDARIVLLTTVNLQSLAGKQIYSADMDGNGEITSVDARMILQKAVEETE